MTTQDTTVHTKVIDALAPFRDEISIRNEYIQKRDDYIYGDQLLNSLSFPHGFDKTLYNWLERVVDIQVSQLMGRSFRIYSSYNKRDISAASDISDPQQQTQDELWNKRSKANADARNEAINGIVRDNGGEEMFQMGAQSGSAYGYTVFKSYLTDSTDKPWVIEPLENLQNYIAIWSEDNFRARDADVYTRQISPQKAQDLYGKYLNPGEVFMTEPQGLPAGTQTPATPTAEEGQQRQMVRVIEYTGKLAGICGDKDVLYTCAPGGETPINVLIVGGKVVRHLTDPDYLPRYYIIPNERLMRRPWGRADVNDTCIEINRTFLQRMSDWLTQQDKSLFHKYMGKNFDAATVPRPVPRTNEIFPMDADQSIEEITTSQQFEAAYPQIITELKDNFVRAARISRVLFDDPTVSADSNAALLTTMKGTIDAVEKKQKIWSPQLVAMFEDALRTLAKHHKDVASFVSGDDNWFLYIKYPSVLRKEDPSYQTMLINRFHTGTMSLDSFLEEQGHEDPGEELDRIRDNMADKVPAAILGGRLATIAEQVNMPAFDPSLHIPQVKHNVQWRADMTPQQTANLATELGWQSGPFGSSMGPQGQEGAKANEAEANDGFLTKPNPYVGPPIDKGPNGKPVTNGPGEGPTPIDPNSPTSVIGETPPQMQDPSQNQPGSGIASQPGSGATPASPAGAIKKRNQNQGK